MGVFRMPSLGADMEKGTLVEWKVVPGQAVKAGDIVATIDTDKGAIDIESFEDVVFETLLVEPGDEADVGAELAVVQGGGVEAAPATEPASPEPAAPEPAPEPEPEPEPRSSALPPSDDLPNRGPRAVRASPSARYLARELGVDLASLTGSGPHGAIKRTDVTAASGQGAASPRAPAPAASAPATRAPAAPRPSRPKPPDKAALRQAIAAAMSKSKREIPHYYLAHEVLIDPALVWLSAQNRDRTPGDRLLLGALLIRAVAQAAVAVPGLNGFWTEAFEPSGPVHVGFAISLRGGGLIAPAILDAQDKSVETVMHELRDLVHRARRGGLRASEMTSPSITISSMGDQGVDALVGVIQPPQVALIGFGTPRERPWAADGMLGVRRVMSATLSGDHRASDGHTGGRFLRTVSDLLQTPESL